ncbi:hypothetical protein CCFV1_ORF082 [Cotesia congregata filamentous virus 1]|uniref:Uncharacterized protein n=1 Tax=Cotesia congregata filamentous virus 1 TaxID=3064291 RepID=A0ABC8QJP9_9VIRU|nr:hypothetical protein CCFV1_ORF082 [Cotesia congregata filamentous virus 1]
MKSSALIYVLLAGLSTGLISGSSRDISFGMYDTKDMTSVGTYSILNPNHTLLSDLFNMYCNKSIFISCSAKNANDYSENCDAREVPEVNTPTNSMVVAADTPTIRDSREYENMKAAYVDSIPTTEEPTAEDPTTEQPTTIHEKETALVSLLSPTLTSSDEKKNTITPTPPTVAQPPPKEGVLYSIRRRRDDRLAGGGGGGVTVTQTRLDEDYLLFKLIEDKPVVNSFMHSDYDYYINFVYDMGRV